MLAAKIEKRMRNISKSSGQRSREALQQRKNLLRSDSKSHQNLNTKMKQQTIFQTLRP